MPVSFNPFHSFFTIPSNDRRVGIPGQIVNLDNKRTQYAHNGGGGYIVEGGSKIKKSRQNISRSRDCVCFWDFSFVSFAGCSFVCKYV